MTDCRKRSTNEIAAITTINHCANAMRENAPQSAPPPEGW